MNFYFNKNDVIFNSQLTYSKEEYSISPIPFPKNVDVGILCGEYTELNCISSTGQLIGLSGYSHKNSWIEKNMNFPVSERGELFVKFDETPMRGTGIEYNRGWKTYFDFNMNVICIGNPIVTDKDYYLEFAGNTIAALRGTNLVSIWGKVAMN